MSQKRTEFLSLVMRAAVMSPDGPVCDLGGQPVLVRSVRVVLERSNCGHLILKIGDTGGRWYVGDFLAHQCERLFIDMGQDVQCINVEQLQTELAMCGFETGKAADLFGIRPVLEQYTPAENGSFPDDCAEKRQQYASERYC